MDGQFDKLEELIYVESHLSNTSAKFYGEITQQMLKNSSFPGSNNGTGLLQVRCVGWGVCVCVWGGGRGGVGAWRVSAGVSRGGALTCGAAASAAKPTTHH
jgi:phosphoribulokinase